jgi:signal transduction histidine kinase
VAGGLAWLKRLLAASSTRLVLISFAVQLLLVSLAMASVYVAAQREIAARDQALVLDMRDDLLAAWRAGGVDEVAALIKARLALQGSSHALLLADDDGAALAGNLPGRPAGMAIGGGWQRLTLAGPGLPAAPYLVLATRLDGRHVLIVGQAAARGDALLTAIWRALAASLALTMPAALVLALLLGRLSAARVSGIAGVAQAVAQGDLARRAPRDGSEDPYDRLAGAINAMLDRIEGLVNELRTVTDGLAHDLRSPLTRLRGRVEQAQAHGADADTLDAMAGDLDRLLTMLTTALQISRAEAGIGRDHFTLTDIADLLEDAADVYGPVAEERGITLVAGAPAGLKLRLHRPLIQQALGNAIENALRHARGATRISLSASAGPHGVDLVVSDDGPGIPPDQHALALSRFGRLDPARGELGPDGAGGGMGLGLALVGAVAHLHGGHVSLASNQPGLRLLIHLPADS